MAGTILNNTAVSPDSLLRVSNPYEFFADPEKPKALSGGKVYFGLPTYDPEQPENRKRVYIAQEDGETIAINQPVALGNGGVPMYNGSPVILLVDGPYSMRVLDKNGASKYYAPKVNQLSSSEIGSQPRTEVLTLSDGQATATFQNVDVSTAVFDITGNDVDDGPLFRDKHYAIADGGAGIITLIETYPAGTEIRGRQFAPDDARSTSVTTNLNRYTFQTLAEAKAAPLKIGDVVELLDLNDDGDEEGGLRYQVVDESSFADDGLNYITIDNGLQLRMYRFRQRIRSYSESELTVSPSGGVLTLDLSRATAFKITLSSNITDVVLVNENEISNNTCSLKVKQGAAGGFTVAFPSVDFGLAGAPTITSTASKEDIIVLTKYSNDDVYGSVFGQGFS
jgi:hypothetical protein